MSTRTLENCTLIRRCGELGIGKPKQYDNKCEGYGTKEMDDEPCYTCRVCSLQISYEN